jgi:hypothetical protein
MRVEIRRRARMVGAFLVSAVLCGCGSGGTTRDLEARPAGQSSRLAMAPGWPADSSGFRPSAMAAGDFDGDGVEELASNAPHGLAIWRWQGGRITQSSAISFLSPISGGHLVSIGAVSDLDGDGCPELLGTSMREDGRAWFLWTCRPAASAVSHLATLPAGPDRRADGVWDGTWYVVGTLPPGAAGERAAVLLICRTGFDWDTRCVLALDAGDGHELWRFACGPNPEWLVTADVDCDDRPEVILTGNSQDNMHGASLNGTTDDTAMLFLLDSRGRLRWSRPLGPFFVNTHLQVGDLDGDGEIEILTATDSHHPAWEDRLSIWRGRDGQLHTERLLPDGVTEVLARFDPATRAGLIYVADAHGKLARYSWTDSHDLPETARTHLNGWIIPLLLADISPPPGSELVLLTQTGRLIVTDSALRPLAATKALPLIYPDTAIRPTPPWHCIVWRAGGDEQLLVAEWLGAVLAIGDIN